MLKKTIVITQSVEQSKDFIKLLNQNQADVFVFPVIKVVSLPISPHIKEIFNHLDKFEWIVFNSINSVRYFFYILMNQFIKFRSGGPRLACLGEKTVQTLHTYGRQPDMSLSRGTVNDILLNIGQNIKKKPEARILLPVSSLENDMTLFNNNISESRIKVLSIYDILPNTLIPQPQIEQLRQNPDAVITFFSREAFIQFKQIYSETNINPSWQLAAINQSLADDIAQSGLKVDIIANEESAEGMMNSILSFLK